MNTTIPTARRAAVACLALAALVAAGFYSTSAYFSDSVEGGISVSTGTADITIEGADGPFGVLPLASDMIPGDVVEYDDITVCNVGSSDLYMTLSANRTSGSSALANALEATVSTAGAPTITGTLQNFPTTTNPNALPSGMCFDLDVSLEFIDSGAAQNHLQDETVTAEFVLEGRTS